MSITLPPLPEPPAWMDDEGDVFARPETPEMALSLPTMLYTTDQLRARDIKVARLVLKAAADLVDDNAAYCSGQTASILGSNADAIRALGVRHHE